MRRQSPLIFAAIAAFFIILTGCQPQQPFYFHEDKDLSHYKGMATEIEYPDVDSCTLDDVQGAIRPFSLQNKHPATVWDLKLEEAIRIALTNNKIMRSIGGQVQGPPEFLLRNSEAVPSIYDPALAESNPRSGVEAALSAFDTQFSVSSIWGKSDTPSITFFPTLLGLQKSTLETMQDTASFQTQLQKTNATGGTFSFRNITSYTKQMADAMISGEISSTEVPANWTTAFQAEMRQPLMRGAGVQFNRIAGPGAQPGVFNGVMLARINTDIALADFEASVRNLVADVETTYWELYFNYRSLDAVKAGLESALTTWRRVYTLSRLGAKGGEAEIEAQARENYFLFRTSEEQALSALYDTEAKLRYLLGLAATDGRLIRPIDEPTTAKVAFDWSDAQCEALARSVELRQQKWVVKRRELELIAAKNFLLPQLDAVGKYTWTGFGNKLLVSSGGTSDIFSTDPEPNAVQSLTHGNMQSWELGFQFAMPIGFRREMAGVRNAQLQIAKERAKLQEAELEVSHQLGFAIRDMEAAEVLSQTNFNRRIAAQRQVEAVAAAYETGTITFDVLLSSQQRLAQAESDYYRSVINYNKAIMQVHYRKGSLLEYNGVYLAEGPWPGKAYFDARRRARARDASTYFDYGFTQPKVISRGPYEQHAGGSTGFSGEVEQNEQDSKPVGAPPPELVPTPEPQPIDPGYQPDQPTPAQPNSIMPEEPKSQPEAGTSNKEQVKKSTALKATTQTAVAASGWKKASKTASKSEVQQAGFQYQTQASRASNSQASNKDWSGKTKKSPLPTDLRSVPGEGQDQEMKKSPLPTDLRSVPGEGQDQEMKKSPLPLGEGQGEGDLIIPAAYESGTHPPTAQSDQPASGWKRISH
jgi:outer membrane protein TolC